MIFLFCRISFYGWYARHMSLKIRFLKIAFFCKVWPVLMYWVKSVCEGDRSDFLIMKRFISPFFEWVSLLELLQGFLRRFCLLIGN